MRRRWSIVLPLCGLGVFMLGAYQGSRLNHRIRGNRPIRYFYWASIRLDSDPLNRHPISQLTEPCENGDKNCVSWYPDYIWVDPGLGTKAFMLAALPAFLLSGAAVRILARFGVSEVVVFFASMPLLISAWFYLTGWFIDRRQARHAIPLTIP